MKRCMLYWTIAGVVLPLVLTVLHARLPGPLLYYLDPLMPLFWPTSLLLLGFKDPAYPANGGEYAWFFYAIGLNMCIYAALGGLWWKAWAWVKEQNTLHGKS